MKIKLCPNFSQLLSFLTMIILFSCSSKSWRDASRDSIGIAPKASEIKGPIFQIYYARAYSWRGIFGVHPWFAWKLPSDDQYTVAQVTSWNIRRNGTAVRVEKDLPDRKWFDHEPTLLYQVKGEDAVKIIEKVKLEIEKYPFKDQYKVWPGPNSNTFVAHIIRETKIIPVELPPHAIGKDYFPNGTYISKTPSQTGFTTSLFGLLGFSLGLYEGLELNILGLHFGLDLWTPAIKLPLAGRIGFPDAPFSE